MSRIKRKKCKNCHNLFVPDARNRDRQNIENTDNSSGFTNHALQDLLTRQPSVLIGIIAQLTGYALQDDIALETHPYTATQIFQRIREQ
jgi:hypothetical protein